MLIASPEMRGATPAVLSAATSDDLTGHGNGTDLLQLLYSWHVFASSALARV